MKVGVNDFVRRQIKGSGKTYSVDFSFDEIAKYAESELIKGNYIQGYRDGVIIINVEPSKINFFKCPLVKVDDNSKLVSKVSRRRDEEFPYIQTSVVNAEENVPGKVQLILYRNDVLKETNENTTNSEWELISINSSPKGVNDLPMKPTTMMRNQLKLPGGTKALYSSDEWAKSVYFWQNYLPVQPDLDN